MGALPLVLLIADLFSEGKKTPLKGVEQLTHQ
jgi:hypothetical protein